ncbi:MAG: L-2-amino-thiazoline-4-carboxylic acid hydrolase [Deltaproteobacteria bacterium]|nr:L-2-amino-thiazoline-4-carboxylic acid hydrolase [Deltaproteobacteria bacterium]
MDIVVNPEISLLDQVKMQAQVLVPVLRELRAALGVERANALVTKALREWSRDTFLRIGAAKPGTPRERWQTLTEEMMPRIGSDIDMQVRELEPDTMTIDITGCRYADFFRALDEPELGAVLLCESDDHIAEVGGDEVQFTRTQTIMKGAKYCDFRYRMKRSEG